MPKTVVKVRRPRPPNPIPWPLGALIGAILVCWFIRFTFVHRALSGPENLLFVCCIAISILAAIWFIRQVGGQE